MFFVYIYGFQYEYDQPSPAFTSHDLEVDDSKLFMVHVCLLFLTIICVTNAIEDVQLSPRLNNWTHQRATRFDILGTLTGIYEVLKGSQRPC